MIATMSDSLLDCSRALLQETVVFDYPLTAEESVVFWYCHLMGCAPAAYEGP